jgi:hypothetical protein
MPGTIEDDDNTARYKTNQPKTTMLVAFSVAIGDCLPAEKKWLTGCKEMVA